MRGLNPLSGRLLTVTNGVRGAGDAHRGHSGLLRRSPLFVIIAYRKCTIGSISTAGRRGNNSSVIRSLIITCVDTSSTDFPQTQALQEGSGAPAVFSVLRAR